MKKLSVAFVCLGNICRSPLAEYLFKDMLKKQGIDTVHVESFGTSNENYGRGMHSSSKLALLNHGIIYLGGHRARGLQKEDYADFDYFLCMDSYNLSDAKRILGRSDKVHRLLDYSDFPRDVADPWYTGNFEKAYDDILEGCEHFMKKVVLR